MVKNHLDLFMVDISLMYYCSLLFHRDIQYPPSSSSFFYILFFKQTNKVSCELFRPFNLCLERSLNVTKNLAPEEHAARDWFLGPFLLLFLLLFLLPPQIQENSRVSSCPHDKYSRRNIYFKEDKPKQL
jgi:hypothetical protein